MKYSEFWEYLRGTNFAREEDDEIIQINTDGLGCVKIAKNIHRQIILPFTVEEPEQFELIRKALELAETPLNERELPLSNDPDEGDFIIKNLDDDEEIKEFDEFYEVSVTELKKFRGKGNF